MLFWKICLTSPLKDIIGPTRSRLTGCAYPKEHRFYFPEQSVVLDSDETAIGSVLTCVTDMGIGWYRDRIYSIASSDKPNGFTPKGVCCGFVKVNKKLETGQTLFLKDNRRTIRVRVVKDIRPDRTARRPINETI